MKMNFNFWSNHTVVSDKKKKLIHGNIFINEETVSVPFTDMLVETVDRQLEDQEIVTFVEKMSKKNNFKLLKLGICQNWILIFTTHLISSLSRGHIKSSFVRCF